MEVKIKIDDELFLSTPNDGDIPSYVTHLNDPDIYKFTLAIPRPYTTEDAREFIKFTNRLGIEYGVVMHWAIRDMKTEKLIGGIGFHGKYPPGSHREEIGYWLAKPFWGMGMMTRVLKRVCQYGFESLNLIRIEAPIFESNAASIRVAEKTGFVHEGVCRKAFKKEDQLIDGVVYALIRESSNEN